MGLLYQLPVDLDESDHAYAKDDGSLVIRSYGLPPIFWAYLAIGWAVTFFMAIAIEAPLTKVIQQGAALDQLLGWATLTILVLAPLTFTGFYFYEKEINKKKQFLTVTHKIFFLPVATKCWKLRDAQAFDVRHFLDSPNMARIQDERALKNFANSGHYQLFALLCNDKEIQIDRSSRKIDLQKIVKMLGPY